MRKKAYLVIAIFALISCKSKIDFDYIEKREWLSESGNIIRFDDKSCNLHNDTVFIGSKADCIIKSLNKKHNEMNVYSVNDKLLIMFTSTEEFVK